MDEASFLQIRSLWPDVAAPFSRIVPDGCLLARTIDDWTRSTGANDALRIRRIDLVRGDRCPPIEDLREEAREDAERRGWTLVDEHTNARQAVLELESVLCFIKPDRLVSAGSPLEVLSVAFHQPWPKEAGAPVETSEMFQNLVRRLLRLGAPPERLFKEVTVDLTDLSRADVLRERVWMARDPDLSARLAPLGFAPLKDRARAWFSNTVSGTYAIEAMVLEADQRVEVEMVKLRLRV
jgi:hypothetical protein